MLQLLKIEWYKIKKYPAFWWMLVIVALTYPGINYLFFKSFEQLTTRKDMAGALVKTLLGNPFAFPETWHSVAFFSSFFIMLPAILVIMLITNEYQYKTHRQNIIDGWSRNAFISGKILDVFIVSIVVTFMYLLTATAFGIAVKDTNKAEWINEIKYIPLFFLQTFAQLSIAFLLGFLIKKAFIALGAFLFYFFIVENIVLGVLKFYKFTWGRFLPFEISDKLVPIPRFLGKIDEQAYQIQLNQINQHILLTILQIGIVWALCFYTFKKRDL